MVNWCSRSRPVNIYRDKPRPIWQRWLVYSMSGIVLAAIAWYGLRDTTPIQFTEPAYEDLNKPRGELATAAQIQDVYWRVSIRQINQAMSDICADNDYNVLTHKNIRIDGSQMPEAYVYLCNPVDGIQAVINPRVVVSGAAKESVLCAESHANVTKNVPRKYPFSLKYVCAQTFTARTRVVRNPLEACTWLHAVDIVESIWD